MLDVGADAPNELGASLTGALSAPVVPPSALTVPAAPAPQVAVTAALPYRSFLRYDFQLRTLPPELQPYALSHPAPLGYGTVDAAGVRMVDRGGRLWNHPAAQAQYGIAMLESHRLDWRLPVPGCRGRAGDPADRRAHAYGGGLFHPYDFPDAPHNTTVRTPPWYSAIGQGQVLDFFTRLCSSARATSAYRSEADGTFKAFLVPQAARKPWVTWVARRSAVGWTSTRARTSRSVTARTTVTCSRRSGCTQYFLLSQDERARQLVQGAFSTARVVAAQARNPGWRSVYCLQDRADSGRYHPTHSLQHLLIYAITGEWSFAAVADTFSADFPNPSVSGTVAFAAGTHNAATRSTQPDG